VTNVEPLGWAEPGARALIPFGTPRVVLCGGVERMREAQRGCADERERPCGDTRKIEQVLGTPERRGPEVVHCGYLPETGCPQMTKTSGDAEHRQMDERS
jgi:hypothetical protein